ncbi:MAG TPA: response regulator [Desulfuromonadales bacterium]|nr:response regulator [Desulfuromonadales bacterium]
MRFLYHQFVRIVLTAAIMLAAVAVLPGQPPLYAALPVPRILILNSYNIGYDWSENEMEGVRDGLSKVFPRVETFIEHLDTKMFHSKQHFPRLADLLEAKYSGHKLDIIIAMDNAALEFATKYRQRISPGTPLVFCGINNYEPSMIAGQSRITGVAEFHDIVGTLKLALQLQPNVHNIIVIHDFTDTGIAINHELKKSSGQFPAIKLHFMEEMPLEETVNRLKSVPPDYLVLMLSYTVEKGGRTFSHAEAARLVSGASPVPVYSVYAEQLGHGVIGGRILKGQTQGLKAAELAVRVLGGELPENIPVVTSDLSHPAFDYLVMKKYAIHPDKLPTDAMIINKPPSTLAINKTIAWVGTLCTLLSTVGLITLVMNVRKRKRLEEMLRLKIEEYQESQEELLATEEMLRSQVDDYIQSQDELLATEEMLRSQIVEYQNTHDQLLATEKMMRMQLDVIAESSQKFEAVFDFSPITVALTTLPEGKYSDVNQGFVEMFGYSREETLGRTTVELGVWRYESTRDSFIKQLKANGIVRNFQAEMRRKNSEVFTVLFSGVLLEIAGKPCVLSAVMDITEQKRLQNQLLQSQKMDAIGQLAGGVAHDFNNMLAGIMAAAELLKLRLKGDEKNSKTVDAILEATTRSAELTRELLTFSRKNPMVVKSVHVNDTVTAVIGLLERTIDKQICVTVRFDESSPVVTGDQTQLQNALLNLGINARDAMPDGGSLLFATALKIIDEIACSTMNLSLSPGRYVEISVSDTGVGMTKEVMEHIFEPFFSTKAIGKGTGLGLATVYGTVQSHKGQMYVQSEPGVGSVFKIFLPLIEDEIGVIACSAEAVVGSGGILLVDDEKILRDVGRELLEDLGYTVYLAESGADALAVFAAHRNEISLVLLDIIMPTMGGKEAFLRLREQAPDLKVLFCSGFINADTDDELMVLGADGFIHKPYNRSGLSRAVAEVMEGKGTHAAKS